MIRPIVLLLVSAACLALLQDLEDCPGYYFECIGLKDGVYVPPQYQIKFGEGCVPFEWNGTKCVKTMSDEDIEAECEALTPPNITFHLAINTKVECEPDE